MNNGLYPQALTPYARVFEFTLLTKPADAQGAAGSYVWSVPADCSLVEFFIIGGGGGGGGGGRYATTSNRFGGGGGASGSTTYFTAPAYFFTAPLSIAIGTGGAGGAGATVNSTAGSAGSSGTRSTISMLGAAFAAAAAGGGAVGASNVSGEGASGGGSSLTGPRTYAGINGLPGGSGSTVGARSGPVPPSGAAGGYCPANGSYVAGGSVTVFGLSGLFDISMQKTSVSTYKSGGDGAANSVGGNGVAGLIYGAGGGGGAASDNGFNAGSGGNGGGGYVRITCY